MANNFPFNKVPDQVFLDLEYEVAKAELDYADNYRAYRYHDNYLRKEYKQAWSQGCCGYFETSTTVDGVKWIIGCNYGH